MKNPVVVVRIRFPQSELDDTSDLTGWKCQRGFANSRDMQRENASKASKEVSRRFVTAFTHPDLATEREADAVSGETHHRPTSATS
jgi:hypothetical protein